MRVLFLIIIILLPQIAPSQDKEVFIIGTMHSVPKIVKRSYKPLLKTALEYQPGAIYVESPQPDDDKSWEYLKNGWSESYKRFYRLSDSLQDNYLLNPKLLNKLLKKDFKDIKYHELETIILSFAYLRDHANYEFYSYLKTFGVNGATRPTRHEDGDLTAKLALALNIKRLKSMDDQQTNRQYHEAWKKCAQDGQRNGDNTLNRKLNKRHDNRAKIPALLGRLGKYVNSKKALERLHTLASFTYVQHETPSCSLATFFWNERNRRMARNIAEQVLKADHRRSVVIVGASHVLGLKEEFRKNYPAIKIITMD